MERRYLKGSTTTYMGIVRADTDNGGRRCLCLTHSGTTIVELRRPSPRINQRRSLKLTISIQKIVLKSVYVAVLQKFD